MKNIICTDIDNLQFYWKDADIFLEFDRVKYPYLFKLVKKAYYGLSTLDDFSIENFIKAAKTIRADAFITQRIYLPKYSTLHIIDILNSYGYEFEYRYSLVGHNDEDSEFLIKECIFEQQNGLY